MTGTNADDVAGRLPARHRPPPSGARHPAADAGLTKRADPCRVPGRGGWPPGTSLPPRACAQPGGFRRSRSRRPGWRGSTGPRPHCARADRRGHHGADLRVRDLGSTARVELDGELLAEVDDDLDVCSPRSRGSPRSSSTRRVPLRLDERAARRPRALPLVVGRGGGRRVTACSTGLRPALRIAARAASAWPSRATMS